MHLRGATEDTSSLLKSPDLFQGERLTKGRWRRLSAVSNFGGVPSRSVIRLSPSGYEYVYTHPTRLDEEKERELPGANLALARTMG